MKDKVIAIIVLFVLLLFLVYEINLFAPKWAYRLVGNKSGFAQIDKFEHVHGEVVMIYSYYNEYEGKDVKNIRKNMKLSFLDLMQEKQTAPITYAKYFSNYVVFSSIDKKPLYFGSMMVCVLVLFAMFLFSLVLFDKLSLGFLAGISSSS